MLDVLDRMRCGGLVVDVAGNVLRKNETAERLMAQHSGLRCKSGLEGLFRAAARTSTDEDAWSVIRSGQQDRPIVVRTIPIQERAASGAHTLLILIDLGLLPQPQPEPLQKIFGLTPTEARLAIQIAVGKSPEQIAEAGQVSINTVRRQLASVLAKTGTCRQPELVALLAHVAILP